KLEKDAGDVQTVKIKTGHGDNEVVYAQGKVDSDGWEQDVDDCPRWIVTLDDLTEATNGIQCHLSDLLNVQISLGNTTKKLFEGEESDEIWFHNQDYDPDTSQLGFGIGGAPRCTILFGSIGPISEEKAELVPEICDPEDFEEEIHKALGGKGTKDAKACHVTFDQIKFNRHAHTCWHIPDWEPELR
ncbi:MAG: hypothetical protein SGARI_001455, partial [Bacillariaceae sp.]